MCEVDGAAISDLEDSVSDTIPYDGVSHWDAISSAEKAAQEPPARRELVLDHCLAGFSTSGTGCNHYGVNHSVGAIIHVSMHAHIIQPAAASLPWLQLSCSGAAFARARVVTQLTQLTERPPSLPTNRGR
jgi:hypothetical protein